MANRVNAADLYSALSCDKGGLWSGNVGDVTVKTYDAHGVPSREHLDVIVGLLNGIDGANAQITTVLRSVTGYRGSARILSLQAQFEESSECVAYFITDHNNPGIVRRAVFQGISLLRIEFEIL